jgi:hypothetical protein
MAQVTQAPQPLTFTPVTIVLTSLHEVRAVAEALGRTSPDDNARDAGFDGNSVMVEVLGHQIAALYIDLKSVLAPFENRDGHPS